MLRSLDLDALKRVGGDAGLLTRPVLEHLAIEGNEAAGPDRHLHARDPTGAAAAGRPWPRASTATPANITSSAATQAAEPSASWWIRSSNSVRPSATLSAGLKIEDVAIAGGSTPVCRERWDRVIPSAPIPSTAQLCRFARR